MAIKQATIDSIRLILAQAQLFENKQDYLMQDHCESLIKYQLVYYFDNFPIDFILEMLERIGYNPALLTDNDGQWVVNEDEMKVLYIGLTYPLPLQWHKSIKEAVKFFVDTIIKNSIEPSKS